MDRAVVCPGVFGVRPPSDGCSGLDSSVIDRFGASAPVGPDAVEGMALVGGGFWDWMELESQVRLVLLVRTSAGLFLEG